MTFSSAPRTTGAMLEPSQILVTGGAGRLGSALGREGCHTLGRAGVDITSPDSIAAALEAQPPALVINAAAYTAVDRAETELARAQAINGDGAGHLARACAARGIPLIHISTDCVFGDGDPETPMTEQSPTDPLSVYGETKLDGERQVLAAGGQAVIARVAWLFDDGPGTFIDKMLTLAVGRSELQLVTDEWGRPTPVCHLSATLLALARIRLKGGAIPAILHLGSGLAVSRYGWAEQIFQVANQHGMAVPALHKVSADRFPTPARRQRGCVLDTSLADGLLEPMPDWQICSADAVKALLG